MVGVGSVNDVSRASVGHVAAREENAQPRKTLSNANTVMAEKRTHMMAMTSIFDIMADANPTIAERWRTVHPNINPNCIPKEEAKLGRHPERRS